MIKYYKEMLEKKVLPDRDVFKSLMEGFNNAGQVDSILNTRKTKVVRHRSRAAQVLALMDFDMLLAFQAYKKLSRADPFVYALAMRSFAQQGDMDNLLKYWKELLHLNMRSMPKGAYNAMIEGRESNSYTNSK